MIACRKAVPTAQDCGGRREGCWRGVSPGESRRVSWWSKHWSWLGRRSLQIPSAILSSLLHLLWLPQFVAQYCKLLGAGRGCVAPVQPPARRGAAPSREVARAGLEGSRWLSQGESWLASPLAEREQKAQRQSSAEPVSSSILQLHV